MTKRLLLIMIVLAALAFLVDRAHPAPVPQAKAPAVAIASH